MCQASFYLVNPFFALFVSDLLTHPPLNLPPSSSLHPSPYPNPPILTSPSSYSRLCLGAECPSLGRVQLRQNTYTESPPANHQTTLPRPNILVDLSSIAMCSSEFQYLLKVFQWHIVVEWLLLGKSNFFQVEALKMWTDTYSSRSCVKARANGRLAWGAAWRA